MPDENGDSLPAYYIIFKVDGEIKTFDKGFTGYESNPFGNATTDNGGASVLWASPDETTPFDADNYIKIYLFGIIQGTYTGSSEVLQLGYLVGGTLYNSAEEVSVTITKYDDVGGVIEGTFYGTVTFTVEDKIITEGKFKVKRVADGTLNPVL